MDEYKKYIENDRDLERRFQQVFCDQSAVEDIIFILHGLHERYELHHGVVSTSILADRYITECFLAHKVDESGAQLKMEITSSPLNWTR